MKPAVVLITGAGSGIGNALARRFREDGDEVVGCDLEANVATTREACDLAVACDVTVRDEVDAVVAAAIERFGRIDALIANAGTGRIGSIEDAPWSDIEDVVRVNLFGVLHCERAVLPVMRQQGSGRIVVVVSRNAELCPGTMVGYNASKAAVVAATRTLARELEGTDVLVNNLIPGPSKTALNPYGPREPDSCYPTARMLATLPAGGPSGRTFFDEKEYPFWQTFIDDVRHPRDA
jgi:NAD(P)-dependent dehydrogenase (short-subunit alcohol dehydrogenase family)